MDIETKTVTTRVHTATATVDMLKGVAIAAVTKQLGISDTAVISSDAKLGTDGSVTVEVVEAVAEAPKPDPVKDPAEAPTAPITQIATLAI